jgi:type IV secretory pathway VirB10-like protein
MYAKGDSMKTTQLMLIASVCAGCLLLMTACGEKEQDIARQTEPVADAQPALEIPAEPAPPIPAAEEVVADEAPAIEAEPAAADEASLLSIKEAALQEQAMILQKSAELQKLTAEKNTASLAAQSGEALESAQQIASLEEQIREHRDRYNQYMLQLKAGDADTSEFTLE